MPRSARPSTRRGSSPRDCRRPELAAPAGASPPRAWPTRPRGARPLDLDANTYDRLIGAAVAAPPRPRSTAPGTRSRAATSGCSSSRPGSCWRSSSSRGRAGPRAAADLGAHPRGDRQRHPDLDDRDPPSSGAGDRLPAARRRPRLPPRHPLAADGRRRRTGACSSSTSRMVPSTAASASPSSSSSPRPRPPASRSRTPAVHGRDAARSPRRRGREQADRPVSDPTQRCRHPARRRARECARRAAALARSPLSDGEWHRLHPADPGASRRAVPRRRRRHRHRESARSARRALPPLARAGSCSVRSRRGAPASTS